MFIKQQSRVVALVVAVAASLPASAVQQSPITPTDRESIGALEPSGAASDQAVSKPVRQLFSLEPTAPPDPFHFQDLVRDRDRFPQGSIQPQQPRTVCGLTIWDVDPDLDPRMRIAPPQPPSVTYAIRKITPPVCGG